MDGDRFEGLEALRPKRVAACPLVVQYVPY